MPPFWVAALGRCALVFEACSSQLTGPRDRQRRQPGPLFLRPPVRSNQRGNASTVPLSPAVNTIPGLPMAEAFLFFAGQDIRYAQAALSGSISALTASFTVIHVAQSATGAMIAANMMSPVVDSPRTPSAAQIVASAPSQISEAISTMAPMAVKKAAIVRRLPDAGLVADCRGDEFDAGCDIVLAFKGASELSATKNKCAGSGRNTRSSVA